MSEELNLDRARQEFFRTDRIGILAYGWITMFGSHHQANEIVLSNSMTKDQSPLVIAGDFIVSIGRGGMVVTDKRDGKRVPVIVRQWEKDTPMFPTQFSKYYVDAKSNEWTHITGTGGKLVCSSSGIEFSIPFNP